MSSTFSILIAIMAGMAMVGTALDPARTSIRVWLPATMMFVCMVETLAVGWISPIAWSAILVATAIWSIAKRHRTSRSDRLMRLHRALSCIAMAGLIACHPSTVTGHNDHGIALTGAVIVMAVAVAGFGISIGVDCLRRNTRITALEPTLMSLSLAAMTVGHLVIRTAI